MSNNGPPEFREWIERARRGDAEAFGNLMNECRSYLLWLANRELPASVQAKGGASDLVQDTFVRAHECFDQFRGESEEALLAWLRRVLLNLVSNFQRRHETDKRDVSREQSIDSDHSGQRLADELSARGASPSGDFAKDEEERRVAEALGRLPDDYRQVIHARYWERKTFEEIGERLGRSAEAVRKLWGRAVQRLQRELNPDDDREAPG